MRRTTDLECLAEVAKCWSRPAVLHAGRAQRGLALIDTALVRGLREWSKAKADGSDHLMPALGLVAEAMLPSVARRARRRLGL